jgi:hypothetical protein
MATITPIKPPKKPMPPFQTAITLIRLRGMSPK